MEMELGTVLECTIELKS